MDVESEAPLRPRGFKGSLLALKAFNVIHPVRLAQRPGVRAGEAG